MPSAALLQAISRLDQAVGRVESNAETLFRRSAQRDHDKKSAIKSAIAEIDSLISNIGRDPDQPGQG